MPEIVYALCSVTSAACALLLLRGWLVSRVRLLLWSAVGFVGIALNNVGLMLDFVIFPDVDFSLWRTVPAAVGVLVLACGLAWESV